MADSDQSAAIEAYGDAADYAASLFLRRRPKVWWRFWQKHDEWVYMDDVAAELRARPHTAALLRSVLNALGADPKYETIEEFREWTRQNLK